MGSALSVLFQNPEQSNVEEETTENDEFHDAVDVVATTDSMNLANQKDLVTDAIESKFSENHVNTSKITYETVASIESELDYYEKVGLVFLLYDQEDNALQSLLVEQANINCGSSTNLISNWAKSKHLSESSWQDRFIEALCVIQNYALLRRLGFKKQEMIERYVPTQPYTSLHLNIVMKALFLLCEQFSKEDIKKLLTYLKDDYRKRNMNFQDYDEHYLELYLLHCFSMKYIKKDDISNLIALLKKMGMISKADMLESIINMITRNISSETGTNKLNVERISVKINDDITSKNKHNFDLTKPITNYANPPEPSCSDNSVIGINSIVNNVPSNDRYHIDPENVGICLIINQKKFYKEEHATKLDPNDLSLDKLDYLEVPKYDLEEREGTDADKATLTKTFELLGFRIIVREDLDHRNMIPAVKEIMQQFSTKDSCFVVCILSHGVENKIYGVNSVPVDINEIKNTLHDNKFSTLLGKPKVLIIQSCQGIDIQKVYRPVVENYVTDGPSKSIPNTEYNLINVKAGVPEKCDLLVCMSTVSGFASVRDKIEGSWYIQELCKVIEERCDTENFEAIFIKVRNRVSSKRWTKAGIGIVTMVPETTTNLTKELFLPKI